MLKSLPIYRNLAQQVLPENAPKTLAAASKVDAACSSRAQGRHSMVMLSSL